MSDSNVFSTIISAGELHQHLHDKNWLIFDCRHDLGNPQAGWNAYQAGHIPGAGFLHMDNDLAGAKTGLDGVFKGRHPLPERATLAARLRAAGVNQSSQIIAYDGSGGMFAARLWWLLRWLGHANSAVLDGGLPAWIAAGGSLSTELPEIIAGDLIEQATLVPQVDAARLVQNLQTAELLVLDARAPERYRGDVEPIDPVGGHIPGAFNRPFAQNLEAGVFKSAARLAAEYSALMSGRPTASIVHQCGSGVTACHNLLAMEIAGLTGTALYPGSWSEWCADTSRPVAQGALA